jgi:uncharacterized protein YlxW (UPF0749 family)
MFIMRSVERQEDAIKAYHATRDVRQKLDEAQARVRELEQEVRELKASKKTEKAVLQAARKYVAWLDPNKTTGELLSKAASRLRRAVERMEAE